MPGFNIDGATADGPPNTTETRRKHRWLFSINGVQAAGDNKATLFLQKANRPSVKYEEVQMHHDQERAYFAGRTEWEPITLEFYDAEQKPDVSKWVWDWCCGSQGVSNIAAVTVALPNTQGYKKSGELEMRDGQGTTTETWSLKGAWPIESNWNDLDYSSSDIAMITVKLRFDRAIRE